MRPSTPCGSPDSSPPPLSATCWGRYRRRTSCRASRRAVRSTCARSGSRNPGGVNALRVLGLAPGRAVLVADVAKGYLACACGRAVAGDGGAHVAGVAAVVGHCYPLWSGFRGGKGVATSFGQCLYTFPAHAPLDLALAVGVARVPGLRRPALVSTVVTTSVWLLASVVWWRRRLPNSWGPEPTAALPLANAATAAVIASRFARALRLRHADDLEVSR